MVELPQNLVKKQRTRFTTDALLQKINNGIVYLDSTKLVARINCVIAIQVVA